MNINVKFLLKIIPFLWALFLFLTQIGLREKLDSYAPFFYSDSQIKLYQTDGFSKNFNDGIGCNWKGESLDPSFENFPFDIPWSYLGDRSCQMAYPIWFPLLMSPLYSIVGLKYIGLATIFMQLFLSLVLLIFLSKYTDSIVMKLFFVTIVYGSSISNTAMHYSEITLCLLLFSFQIILMEYSKNKFKITRGILIGILSGFILAIRPEYIFFYASFFILYLLFQKYSCIDTSDQISLKFLGSIIIGLLISIGFISTFNYYFFDHYLGLRGLIVSKDVGSLDINYKLSLISTYLYGNDNQVGLFPYMMLVFLSPFLLFVRSARNYHSIYIFAGTLSVISIILFSPYNADSGYSSLRFFEYPWLIISLGIVIFVSNLKTNDFFKKTIAFGILFIQSIIGMSYLYQSNLHLISVSKAQSILQIKLKDKIFPLVHTSMFTGYLTGEYYLKAPVFLVYSDESRQNLLSSFEKNGISYYSVLHYSGEIPFNINYKGEKPIKIFSSINLNHFPGIVVDSLSLSNFHWKLFKLD